jgi:hypothetical protein
METSDALMQNAATPFLGVLKGIEVVKTIANSMTDAMLGAVAPNIIRSLS